jgi:hypothetical protein
MLCGIPPGVIGANDWLEPLGSVMVNVTGLPEVTLTMDSTVPTLMSSALVGVCPRATLRGMKIWKEVVP